MSSVSLISYITVQLNRYTPIPVFILGVAGNIFNIVIFTRPSFVKNPCSTYFFYASIADLNVLFFGLVVRNLADGFKIDLLGTNLVFCRLRYFIMHSSMVLSLYLIILAGVDRYCITSRQARRRRLSNIKYARYSTACSTLVCLLIYSHALGLFTIEQSKSGPSCYAQSGPYRLFYDFLYSATYSFIPPVAMIIVGLATLHNMHRLHAHINPIETNHTDVYLLRKKDRQLAKMLLAQFILTVIFTLPAALQKLYVTLTQNLEKSPYDLAIENLTAQMMRVFGYINSSTSFYVFIFSGSGFRLEFGQILAKVLGCFVGENNCLHRRFKRLVEGPPTAQLATVNTQQSC